MSDEQIARADEQPITTPAPERTEDALDAVAGGVVSDRSGEGCTPRLPWEPPPSGDDGLLG